MVLLIQNFLLFQIGWLACVLGGANAQFAWLGTLLVVPVIVVHLLRADNATNEIMLIMLVTAIGVLWDSGLTLAGLYQFSSGVMVDGLAPHWLIAMWALFATTLNVSMKWLRDRYFLAAVFGGLGGPLAYYAGHRLGAVDFSSMPITLLIIGAGWSLIMPLLVYLGSIYNGYATLVVNKLKAETL